MTAKTVLIAGASGLVGCAAMKHFASEPGCRVIALSRRKPDELFGAEFIASDLTNESECQAVISQLSSVTHLVYAALHERPGLVEGWREAEQIAINDRMLRNLLGPLEAAAPNLSHVSLLQGTKAYGVHARPMQVPAREGRSEARDVPNFYWNQEDFLRQRQVGKSWTWSIFRPVLIVGYSLGSAMNVIPAIGAYGAILKAAGEPLYYPGGPERVAQVVDADLLARAIAWAGTAPKAQNEIFNVANGDVFVWQNVWPAIADTLGMRAGPARSCRMAEEILPREAEWTALRRQHDLLSPDLKSFVGLSFQYVDYQMGTGRATPAPPAFSSTIKLMQAGFTEVMDSEAMYLKWFKQFQDRRLLPPK